MVVCLYFMGSYKGILRVFTAISDPQAYHKVNLWDWFEAVNIVVLTTCANSYKLHDLLI